MKSNGYGGLLTPLRLRTEIVRKTRSRTLANYHRPRPGRLFDERQHRCVIADRHELADDADKLFTTLGNPLVVSRRPLSIQSSLVQWGYSFGQ
jgi:hypothetical protein